MAQIPQITRERLMGSSQVGTPGVDPSAQEIGQAMGAGASEVAGAGFDLAIQRQQHLDLAQGSLIAAQTRMDTMGLLENYKKQYADNPEDASKSFFFDANKIAEKNAAGATTLYAKQIAMTHDPLFEGRIAGELAEWQYSQRDNLNIAGVMQKANAVSAIGAAIGNNNQMSYPQQQEELTTSMLAIKHMAVALMPNQPEKWPEMEAKLMGGPVKNMADAYITSNPARAIMFLNSDTTKKYMDGKTREELLDNAQTKMESIQKDAALQSEASAMVGNPAKFDAIGKGDWDFQKEMLDDPHRQKPGANAVMDFLLSPANPQQAMNQIEAANTIMAMHDRAYNLGLEARGVMGDEAKDKKTPTQSIQDLTNFQIDTFSLKHVMSPAAFNQFNREVTGPLTALVSNLHTPGLLEQAKGTYGNFWKSMPWATDKASMYKVDANAAAYNQIQKLAEADGHGSDSAYKLNALNHFFTRMQDIQPGDRDPRGQPWNAKTVAQDIMGKMPGKIVNVKDASGKTVSFTIKDYDDKGDPIYTPNQELQDSMSAVLSKK